MLHFNTWREGSSEAYTNQGHSVRPQPQLKMFQVLGKQIHVCWTYNTPCWHVVCVVCNMGRNKDYFNNRPSIKTQAGSALKGQNWPYQYLNSKSKQNKNHPSPTCTLSICWGKIRRKSSGRLPSNGGFQFLYRLCAWGPLEFWTSILQGQGRVKR